MLSNLNLANLPVVIDILKPLKDVDEGKVTEGDLLPNTVNDAEDDLVKNVLEQNLEWDELLEGGSLLQLECLKAHRG